MLMCAVPVWSHSRPITPSISLAALAEQHVKAVSQVSDSSSPLRGRFLETCNGSRWPTCDVPHQLTASPKPGAQHADPKVSFAVLCSQVARPGFGH